MAAGLGLVFLGLWLSGVPPLIQFVAWRCKTNACLCLVLGGAALIASGSPSAAARRVAAVLAAAMTAIAAVTLLEYVAGIDVGIDELIARDWPVPGGPAHPNRMSPNAAASFLLLGPALLSLGAPRLARIGQGLALGLLALVTIALVGYLYDAAFLYRVGTLRRLSPYTAVVLGALATGTLALRPELGVLDRLSGAGIGRYLARRLLVPVIAVPIALDWLRLQGQGLGWWDQTTGLVLDTLVYIAIAAALVLYLARSLDVLDARRQLSERELRHTAELTAALAQARTVEDVARVTAELGVSALGADAGSVFVVEPDGARLRMVASRGYPERTERTYATLPVAARAPICDAVRDRSAVFVGSVDELRERYPELTEVQPATCAVAAVPLVASGGVLGAVGLSFHGRRPDAQARARIDRLVGQCAQALDRAALSDSERAARDAARAANRIKDQFLAMLGHELRNPLAPIAHALELMRLRNPEAHHEREVIERQVRHMTRLVDDLLDVSRIARGKIELARSRVELAAAVDDAVELVRSLADERRHALIVHADRGLAIDGDRARVVQIISNLLTNAVKYTPAGGRIELVAGRDGDRAVVQCTDTGVGIPAGLLRYIFDPFVQHEATLERAMGGLGLGLAIVRSLVELHGGTVTAASEGEGRGATFTVTLPALPAATVAAEPAPARLRRASSPRRVLIVDDNEDAAEMMGEALALAGHTVQIAHDGARGLELADQFDPDCVMLDIGLPTIDGYDVARQLRVHDGDRHRMLVAITGYGQDHDVRRALDAGFDRHLVKPVSLAVAMEIIENTEPIAPR
ncbi:MAG TPA: ATP-binding protein [Kofleriaceae bacterium]|nr:ATP-binding protein [Kofleriaceae bacterium]